LTYICFDNMHIGMRIKIRPIGTIHSPFSSPTGTPIQSAAGRNVRATVEIYPEYSEGLRDLEGFSHLILLYYFHLAKPYSLTVLPYMDSTPHGVFATRAPSRPNPIGLSTVRLVSREKNILTIEEVDIIDGTPLIDIKPYVSDMDIRQNTCKGWLEKKIQQMPHMRDDSRFAQRDPKE